MSSNRANGTPASSSWRSTLPIHPAAELFPRMPPDELRALGEDIIKNGLTSPIVLWQPDSKSPARLLDGISRLDAIEIATGSPVIVGAAPRRWRWIESNPNIGGRNGRRTEVQSSRRGS
jgi:hypothetical protein